MKLNKYNVFEKNLRSDEHSHLNDKLNNNSRWDDSTYDPEDDNDDYDSPSSYGDDGDDALWNRNSTFRDNEYEDDNDDVDEDDMQHLIYLLRAMFKNSGVVANVTNKGMDITITCVTNKRERLKHLIKIFEVANKLRKDILSQYDSELEMWETRKGIPMIVFNFLYGEGLRNDRLPF